MNPFYFDSKYKSAFLANVATRLRDVINDDCAVLLKQRGIITPITDVSTVMFIAEYDLPSIAEIAKALDYSHQRTAARITALEKLGLVARFADENDSRCQRISLTALGRTDFKKVREVYVSASTVFDEIIEEQGVDIMKIMMNTTKALTRYPVSERIADISTIDKE